MKRGEVYTARFDPIEGSEQGGTRPAVIVSRDVINDRSSHVIVVPLTSDHGRRRLPSHTVVAAGDGGLRNNSVALGEQVRALSKSRLGRQWGTLSPTTMREIDETLRSALALDGLR
ncbi:MAG: type II toxin-antitoxin system PemK/MazF family toxin [Tepidiformaceae bacterium]